MRHRLGGVVGLSALSVLIVACGGTSIGCGGDIYMFTSDAAELAGAEDFDLEVCVDGHCSTRQTKEASAHPANDTLAFDSGRSEAGDVMIEIEATTTDGVVRSASGTVELDEVRPNGLFRAPVCAVADITIVDGEVRNAEPNTFPPRNATES